MKKVNERITKLILTAKGEIESFPSACYNIFENDHKLKFSSKAPGSRQSIILLRTIFLI